MAAQGRYLVFVSKPSGYELVEREGELPEPGAEVEIDAEGRYVVVKLGPSPLPDDGRTCAYLQPA